MTPELRTQCWNWPFLCIWTLNSQKWLKYQRKHPRWNVMCIALHTFYVFWRLIFCIKIINSQVLGHHQKAQPVPAAKHEAFLKLFCLYPWRIKRLFIKNSWHVQIPPVGLGRLNDSCESLRTLLEKLTEKNNNNRQIISVVSPQFVLLFFIDILMLVTVKIKFVDKYWKQTNNLPLLY